jgi:hypothetical protein
VDRAPSDAQRSLDEALAREAEGQRALLAGDREAGEAALVAAAGAYRASWEAAGPRSFGRLVGMLKAALLAGERADVEAAYVRAAVPEAPDSPTAAYAAALAALTLGDGDAAQELAARARSGGDAFARTADAIAALARADAEAYAAALDAILADFAARPEHLTGVRIADTAAVLEVLAARRGLAVRPASDLLPPG